MQGKKIGPFILEEKLNAGGFGEIWKAYEEEDPDHQVALKILSDHSWIDFFKREASTMSALSHPQICQALSSDLEGETPYIALEYIEGQNLRQVLKEKGAFSLKKSINYLQEILVILSYLHKEGFVHCDLKPENIIVQQDGHLKLLDFGLAVSSQKAASQVLLSGVLDTATRQGDIAGTLQYMAPEQKKGEPLVPATDFYALGIMFFELLTGELPELGEVPSQFVPTLPGLVDQIFLKCVARKEKRFQSTMDILIELNKLDHRAPQTDQAKADLTSFPAPATRSISAKSSPPAPRIPSWKNFKSKLRHACQTFYRATKISVLIIFLTFLGFSSYYIYKAGQVDPNQKQKAGWFKRVFRKLRKRWRKNKKKKEDEKNKQKSSKKIREMMEKYNRQYTLATSRQLVIKEVASRVWKKVKSLIAFLKKIVGFSKISPQQKEGIQKLQNGFEKLDGYFKSKNPNKKILALEMLQKGREVLKKNSRELDPKLFEFIQRETNQITRETDRVQKVFKQEKK